MTDHDELPRLITAANALRGWKDTPGPGVSASGADAEAELEGRFGISRVLAVYGTLAPGRPNHHIVAPLGGEWSEGVIEGDLSPEGWGAALGYPAFRPRRGGPRVGVHVLTAPALATDWPRLDAFEGPGYLRILVPVFHPNQTDDPMLITVANIYAAATARPGDVAR